MKKILLVEDDPLMVDIYTTKFKEAGFSVEVASSGKEGWKKIKNEKPDLLLLDIVLPEVTGLELLKKIKTLPSLSKIPVIILSNLAQKKDVEEGLRAGAKKYLIKAHFTPSQVVEEIKGALK
jgi:DNA-binding response OmpR family regulator